MRNVLLALVLLLSACAKKTPQAEPTTPEPTTTESEDPPAADPASMSDADFEKVMTDTMGFVGAMADAVTAANGDCAVMASSMKGVIDSNADLLEQTQRFDQDKALGERAEQWMQAHKDEFDPVVERLVTGIGPCQQDPAVGEQMGRLGGGEM